VVTDCMIMFTLWTVYECSLLPLADAKLKPSLCNACMMLTLTLSILPRLRLKLRLRLRHTHRVRLGLRLRHECRLSCCVAGNCDLAVKETDVKETLELLGERLGFPQPQAEWAPWVPSEHPLGFLMVSHVLLQSGVSGCPAKARKSSTRIEVQLRHAKMTPIC